MTGGGQLWGHLLAHTCVSWFCSLPYCLCFPLFPCLVNYGDSFTLMECTRLAMWFWVGCLRFTTRLSSPSLLSPQSQISQGARGEFHTHIAGNMCWLFSILPRVFWVENNMHNMNNNMCWEFCHQFMILQALITRQFLQYTLRVLKHYHIKIGSDNVLVTKVQLFCIFLLSSHRWHIIC